jgi:hypothetical protein
MWLGFLGQLLVFGTLAWQVRTAMYTAASHRSQQPTNISRHAAPLVPVEHVTHGVRVVRTRSVVACCRGNQRTVRGNRAGVAIECSHRGRR